MAVEFSASADELPSGGRVVHVEGPVDLYAARELKELLVRAVDASGGRLVVDLTASTFLDSSALSALFTAHRRAQHLGGRVVLVNTDGYLAQTLHISGLDAMLDVVDTVGDARELLDGA